MQRSEHAVRGIPVSALVALTTTGCPFWAPVMHTDGWFVSIDGQIASFRKKRMRILKGLRCGKYLALGKHGDDRRYVHHIVCEAWHGPRPDGMEVRHLDGNRDNNHASNLAWGTRRENAADKLRHGTSGHGERNPMAKLTRHDVEAMRRIRAATGWSYRRIGEHFGVSQMTAYRAVTGQTWGGDHAN